MDKLKLKICGLKDTDNIRAVLKYSPDFIGFIFYAKSPRYAGNNPQFLSSVDIPDHITKTGVFVNEPLENIRKIADRFALEAIQLHGDESPEVCALLKKEGTLVIKVFSIGDDFNFNKLDPYKDYVDHFMFDTKGKYFGGNGIPFDWSLLEKYPYSVPFFLSGGIGPDNIDNIKYLKHPSFFAIDINSRIESAPGLKDISKLSGIRKRIDTINI